MTGTRDSQQDGSIQEMLSDSDLETAAELRSALEQLRALVPDAAPVPRADLAALLAAGAAGSAGSASAPTTALSTAASAKASANESLPTGVTRLAERRGRKRRLAIVGGAVVGAMTLGAGAVAASSEDFRRSVSQTVGVIFQPAGEATPEQVQPSPSPVLPVPADTSGSSPADVPGGAPAGAGKPGGSSTPGSRGTGHGPGVTPPAVGRDGILPTPGQRPETPGLPAAPGLRSGGGNGSGGGEAAPLSRPRHADPAPCPSNQGPIKQLRHHSGSFPVLGTTRSDGATGGLAAGVAVRPGPAAWRK